MRGGQRGALWVEAAALAVVTAAAAALFARLVGMNTDYDEGVYLVSADALRHGQELGEEVFAPQPPGWYAVLRLGGVLGADSVTGFHVWMTVLAVGACLATYALARRLAGPAAGLTAAALLVVAPPFPLYAHRVLADIPPLGLAAVALWLAVPPHRSQARVGLAGAAFALAASVKLTAVLALPGMLAFLLLARPRARRAVAAATGAAGVLAAFAIVHARALDDLWGSAVVYHREARATPEILDGTHELLHFLNFRTPFAWLALLGALASVEIVRRRRIPLLPALWSWAALAAVFVLQHEPLHDNHLLVLPVTLALPAGTALGYAASSSRAPAVAAAALALALAAGYVQQHRRLGQADVREEPELVWAGTRLEAATRGGELVASDQPIAAYLSGRRVPGELVDTAVRRFATGSLTVDEVLRVLDERDVAAVAAGRAFTRHPELLAGLERRYANVARRGGVSVYSTPR